MMDRELVCSYHQLYMAFQYLSVHCLGFMARSLTVLVHCNHFLLTAETETKLQLHGSVATSAGCHDFICKNR